MSVYRLERCTGEALVWFGMPPPLPGNVLKDVFEALHGPSSSLTSGGPFQRASIIVGLSLTRANHSRLTPTRSVSAKKAHRLEMLGHLKRLLDCGSHPRETKGSSAQRGLPRKEESHICSVLLVLTTWPDGLAKAIYAVKIMLFHDQLS
ncbi:hypothetical protein GWK47_041258 [Chionoecetes opilio]|uniref:Uncharacterized protein n=1 Tax=Chionoecetes opilio TaxID=41210 RepID=A0A8J4YP79_CHIOP|nr:hypothetical protein GWK47_041258 [Chionoecetes opilio]